MTFSLAKLEKVLNEHSILIKNIYTQSGDCIYIEIYSVNTGDNILLYIPSKYSIPAPSSKNVFKIKDIEISEEGTIVGDYTNEPDKFELEKIYTEIDLPMDTAEGESGKKIEEKMEEKYDRKISLKNIDDIDIKKLREIFRQLKRLALCVQSVKYKLCICYKHYICCIHRDGTTLKGYNIKEYKSREDNMRLLATVDLPTFYEKLSNVTVEIKQVLSGVQKVLDRNQNKHTEHLSKILEQRATLLNTSKIIFTKKKEYQQYLEKLEKMLIDIQKVEEIKNNSLKALHNTISLRDKSIKAVHSDTEDIYRISSIETEIENILKTKQEILTNMSYVRTKYDNISLQIDNICFDLIVLTHEVALHYYKLSQL